MFFVHDKVLEQNDETALRRADGEKQINHADDGVVAAQNENAAAIRLFEDQTQSAKLFVFVRLEIAFLAKQFAQKQRELVEIVLGRRLDDDSRAHACSYSRIRGHWQTKMSILPECVDNYDASSNVGALLPRKTF
jgi:hypothetical protein